MGNLIDAKEYFDLSSWLPEIYGKKRIDIIREWIEFSESLCECDSHELHLKQFCHKAQKGQIRE